MHVYFLCSYILHTFFWTLELNATDTTVCSPHISLLCSFNKTTRAMQIPGWCCWKRVGACVFNSSMKASSVNSSRWSIPICRNEKGLLGFFRHTALHSAVITSKILVILRFCSSWCAKSALAIEGIFPPFKARPSFCRSGLKVAVRTCVGRSMHYKLQ